MCDGTYLSEEGAVELHDVGTVAAPHDDVQVHQQLLLLLLVHGGANPLREEPQTTSSCFWCLLAASTPPYSLEEAPNKASGLVCANQLINAAVRCCFFR